MWCGSHTVLHLSMQKNKSVKRAPVTCMYRSSISNRFPASRVGEGTGPVDCTRAIASLPAWTGRYNQTRTWLSDKQGSFHDRQALLLPLACAIRVRVLYEERQRWEKSTSMVKCLDPIELHHENARQGAFRRLLSSCASLIGWNHRPNSTRPQAA